MRKFGRLLFVVALLILPGAVGCSFIAALLDMEETQREWVGDPAAPSNERFTEGMMQRKAEIDRIYN